MSVYLTNEKIIEQCHVNPEADVVIAKNVEIDTDMIFKLIIARRIYLNAIRYQNNALESFEEKFKTSFTTATGDLKHSFEYIAINDCEQTKEKSLNVINLMERKGYSLLLNS